MLPPNWMVCLPLVQEKSSSKLCMGVCSAVSVSEALIQTVENVPRLI